MVKTYFSRHRRLRVPHRGRSIENKQSAFWSTTWTLTGHLSSGYHFITSYEWLFLSEKTKKNFWLSSQNFENGFSAVPKPKRARHGVRTKEARARYWTGSRRNMCAKTSGRRPGGRGHRPVSPSTRRRPNNFFLKNTYFLF